MVERTKHSYEFEGYRLDAQPLGLWREGELVAVPPKILEMLILLVEKKGEIVTTDELLDTVWKDTNVEEGNIKYTVSLLRKALGKELVQTIPRRGYRFVAEVREVTENGKANLPADVAEIPKSEIVAPKRTRRPILLAILLLSVFFLTSSAFWWTGDSPRSASTCPVP